MKSLVEHYFDAKANIICDDHWRPEVEMLPDTRYRSRRVTIHTPGGDLTTVLSENDVTEWITEHLIKDGKDMDQGLFESDL